MLLMNFSAFYQSYLILLWISCALSFVVKTPTLVHHFRKNVNKLYSTSEECKLAPCRIKVLGVGGGGGNAVNRIISENSGINGVEFWSLNTDSQALVSNLAPNKLTIGKTTSKGLGAGGNPSVGKVAAEESCEAIRSIASNADLVFVTAGMGGGTGSGASPVVADICRKEGALTIGIVTKPFAFEGKKRMMQAVKSIENLRKSVDTLIVISNDKLLSLVPENTPLMQAFLKADEILRQGIIGISDIIVKPGLVNVDFADIRSIMTNAGMALMGIGHGKGKNRSEDAAMAAISSPLLDFPIVKAKGIIFNIVGGHDLTLQEIKRAADIVHRNVDEGANIIFGALIDDRMQEGEVAFTVLATGFPESSPLSTTVKDSIPDALLEESLHAPSATTTTTTTSSSSSSSSLNPKQQDLSSVEARTPKKSSQHSSNGILNFLRRLFFKPKSTALQ